MNLNLGLLENLMVSALEMHRKWVFIGEKTASIIFIAASSMIFQFGC